jgi:ATP-binding cassette subfamily F protein 3
VLDQRSAGRAGARAKASTPAGGQERRREAAKRREGTAPLRKRVKQIEDAIAMLQQEIASLDVKLAQPSLYQQPTEAAFLAKSRADAVRKLARSEEEWLAASAAVDEAQAAE